MILTNALHLSLWQPQNEDILSNGTKVPDHTDWHDIVLFKNLSKYAEKYIHKGDKTLCRRSGCDIVIMMIKKVFVGSYRI